jgi:tRNA-specific 2-thiouridylase
MKCKITSVSEREINSVLLALSGGIDSSVSAHLLKKQQYKVIGITFDLCGNEKLLEEAQKVSSFLKIEHHIINLREVFREKIIEKTVESYRNGETPSPCCICNEVIKFSTLQKYREILNCDFVATGHYAKIVDGKLYGGEDKKKDQGYFLYSLMKFDSQFRKRILFPLGTFTKEKVREIALQENIPSRNNKESTDTCFNLKNELSDKGESTKGQILFKNQVVGFHNGIENFTIGQSKGLPAISGKKHFVKEIRAQEKEIIISDDRKDLESRELTFENDFFIFREQKKYDISIRYRSVPKKGIIKNNNRVVFEESVFGITRGQHVVVRNEEDKIVGGGIIK